MEVFSLVVCQSVSRTAVIKPLLKQSNHDQNSVKNYRLVSNLQYISKLLECVVMEQKGIHLNENNLLDKFQSAYCVGFSTETALLRVMNDLLCNEMVIKWFFSYFWI